MTEEQTTLDNNEILDKSEILDEISEREKSLDDVFSFKEGEPEDEPADNEVKETDDKEPEPEPEPEPEKDEDGDVITKEDSKKLKTNPEYARERKANKKIKELQERERFLQETLSKVAGTNTQQQQTQQTVAEPPKPAVNPFDIDIEPDSHNLWNKNTELEGRLNEIQQQNYLQQLSIKKDNEEIRAIQANPDYTAQKQFLIDKQTSISELQNFNTLRNNHPQATDEQIRGFIKQQASQQVENTLIQTLANGGNLSETVDQYATSFGYSKPAEKTSPPKANLKTINKNKSKSASLNGGGLGQGKTNNKVNKSTLSFHELLNTDINDIDFDS